REDAEEVRVLLGTDGSEGAERAVRTLLELADPARCSVVVMSVATSTRAEASAEAATHGERAASLLREAGFTAQVRISSGHPGRLLLEEAGRGDHGLVVVGSRGTSRVRRAVLGSVSDQLVRRSRATLVGR
ncbi:MAG: universal stress protein, partial [Actinomycetota bacterium]